MGKKTKWKPKKAPWWGWAHTGIATLICTVIGALVLGPIGMAIGCLIGLAVSSGMKKYLNKNYGITVTDKSSDSRAQPDPRPQPAPSQQTVESTMQYLGNLNTMELHDLSNLQPSCRIGLMKDEHKTYFETIESALKCGYNGCRWCLREYHTD